MNLGSLMAVMGVDTSRLKRASQDMKDFGKESEASFARADRGASSLAGTIMKVVSVTSALYVLRRTFSKVIDASIQQEEAMMRVQTVLESTGGVSGKTADELAKTAEALQKVTRYGDETIMELQALLLTFKDIKGDVFDQATKAAMNLSVAMKQGLKESAVMLGKALNDPILGLTAMRRVGIQFTAEQEKMIKGLVEAGDIMGAQKLILKELESQFGGMAENMRKNLGGAIEGFKNAWGDLFEVNKYKNFDMLRQKIEALVDVISSDKAKETAEKIFGLMIDGAAKAVDAIINLTDLMEGVFAQFDAFKQKLAPINNFLDRWDKTMRLYSDVMSRFWRGETEAGGGGWGGKMELKTGPGPEREDRSKSGFILALGELGYDETVWRNLRKNIANIGTESKVSAEAVAKYEKELAKARMTAKQLAATEVEEWYKKQTEEIGGTTEALEELRRLKLADINMSPMEGLTQSLSKFAVEVEAMRLDTINSIRQFGVEAGVAGDTFKEALLSRAEDTADALVARFKNPQLRNIFIATLAEMGRKSGNALLSEISNTLATAGEALEPIKNVQEQIDEILLEKQRSTGKEWHAFAFITDAKKQVVEFSDGVKDRMGNLHEVTEKFIAEFQKVPDGPRFGEEQLDASIQNILRGAETIKTGLTGAFSEDIYTRFTEGVKENLTALTPVGEQVGQGVGNGLYNGIVAAGKKAVAEIQTELNSLRAPSFVAGGATVTDAMRGDW